MLAVFNLLFSLLTTVFSYPNPTYLVTQVYDGDSFQVDNLWQVRLTNVDAPEKDLCLYQQSKDYLSKLILYKRVSIKGKMFDDFGRLLSQVYLGNDFINAKMISAGMARYTSGDFPGKDELMTVNTKTKQAKIGIYSSQCLQTTNPDNPKCVIKGNLKDGHKIYSFPGCGSYANVELSLDQGDQWFCTESAARTAGFTRALNCP